MEERNMQNWRKLRNYRKQENSDGTSTYIIIVDGAEIEVSNEVYTAYAASERKLEYIERDLKRDRVLQDAEGRAIKDENGLPILLPEREVSLDKLINDRDMDFPSTELSGEEAFFTSEYCEATELYRCLSLLADDERDLIEALFFQGLTEAEYASQLGVTQQNINKRKQRVLKKIKKIWV